MEEVEHLFETEMEPLRKRSSKVSAEPESELRFISGQRGNPKLVVDGYAYVRNKGNDMNIYWRCSQKRATKCKAKAVTNLDLNRCTLTVSQHNHPRDILK